MTTAKAKKAAASKPASVKKAATPVRSKASTPAKKSTSKATPRQRTPSRQAAAQSGKRSGSASPNKKAVKGSSANQYIYYPDKICANDFVNPRHDALTADARDNQAAFFEREADKLHWFRRWTTTIDTRD